MTIVRKCPVCDSEFRVWDCNAKKAGQFRFCSSACRKRNTKMEAALTLTADRLRNLLNYDPITGEFTWAISRPGVRAGDVAGSVQKGYLIIGIGGKDYPAAAIAWLHVTGGWPENLVDHRNRDSLDNRFENLREATYHENNINKINRNKTGHQGVRWSKKSNRWEANLVKDGKAEYLGGFSTKEEAGATYQKAHVALHGAFSPFFNHEPGQAISSAP